MILKLNTQFEDYIVKERICQNGDYREVYRAVDDSGEEVTLIVYDMNNLPECYKDGVIPEMNLIPNLLQGIFPSFRASGTFQGAGLSLKWIARKYVDGITLTSYIKNGNLFQERDALENFYNVLVGIKEISWRLDNGSHNNINTDNIIVTANPDGSTKWYIVGLNCISKPCRGNPPFDTKMLNVEFCAPETTIGIYREKTDIFSLGIVLSYILQQKHPWTGISEIESEKQAMAVAKYIRSTPPEINVDAPLYDIIKKAIAPKQSLRYKNLKEFGIDIAKYLGKEDLRVLEGFCTSWPTLDIPKEEKDDCENNCEYDSNTQQQSLSQPKANVRIEKVIGDGFKCVAGMGELKSKLTRDFIDIVKNKELAQQFQITPPNGILLWGPPGTGKTYISRRLGEEAGMLYTLIRPSDLGNTYIHGTQLLISDLFSKAEQNAKESGCSTLLVFDEIDAIVPKRGTNDDNNQANEVAEFLTQLNNCAERGVYVVATTNRIDAIDPAIMRKGRMDEVIYVGLPDEEARKELIELELSNRPHEDVDTDHIAQLTKGYTSSDIAYIIKECARCSFEESLKTNTLIKISQNLIEKTISSTRASVSEEDIRQYERTRELYSKNKKEERPRLGFLS